MQHILMSKTQDVSELHNIILEAYFFARKQEKRLALGSSTFELTAHFIFEEAA
jgi:hypothetical protein